MSRRSLGLETLASTQKRAHRHARLVLLAAAQVARTTDDAVIAADARTSMQDAHAALDALRASA